MEESPRVIKYFVVPGGQPLQPGRKGDAGINAYPSAIVRLKQDNSREHVWTLGDRNLPLELSEKVVSHDGGTDFYPLQPGEEIMLELGIIFGGNMDWYAELVPRSKGANRKISVRNLFDKVPIDANFRLPPVGLYRNESRVVEYVYQDWSVSQFIFHCRCCRGEAFFIPQFEQVYSVEELGHTERGGSWSGSSDRNRELMASPSCWRD